MSLFKKFPKRRGYLKLLVYGDPGTEKTRRALSMPGPVYIIDMENGSTDYGDLVAEKDAFLFQTRSHIEALKAVQEICDMPPGKCGTLIIDPISQIWSSLQQGHIEKMCRKKRCAPEDVFFDVSTWGKLKRFHGDFLARILSAPCHVIMTARGKTQINEKGRKTGYSYEGEKSTAFLANVVIESHPDGDVVVKDRTGTYTEKDRQKRIPFTSFLGQTGKAVRELQSETDASVIDASEQIPTPKHPSWNADRRRFCATLTEMKYRYEEVATWCANKNRPRPSRMPQAQRDKLLHFLKENPDAIPKG